MAHAFRPGLHSRGASPRSLSLGPRHLRSKPIVGRVSGGIPVVMWVYGNANPSGGGAVTLKDSAGTTIASITSWTPSTPAWQSVTFNLPATADKYDLQLNGNGVAAMNLYAVSIYEY